MQLRPSARGRPLALLLGSNAVWHAAASYYFLCRPIGILKKYFNVAPTPSHAYIVQYLGGINSGFSLLALLALWRMKKGGPLQSSDFFVLSLANFSQFAMDVILHSQGVAKRALFMQITLPDGLFFILDLVAAIFLFAKGL